MMSGTMPCASSALKEAAQLFGTGRVTQLAQGLGFDLADALAGDVELLADFFQRVVGVHFDAEAHAQHLGFARRQVSSTSLVTSRRLRVQRRVARRQRRLVLDEVAEVGIVVVADRRFHRDRLLGDLEDLADLLLGISIFSPASPGSARGRSPAGSGG
jgi:hypothetical protein